MTTYGDERRLTDDSLANARLKAQHRLAALNEEVQRRIFRQKEIVG